MDAIEKDVLQRAMDAQIRYKGDIEAIHKSFDEIAIQFLRDKGADKLADTLQLSNVVRQFKYGDE